MKKYKLHVILFIVFFICYAGAEYILRNNGFIPGVLAPRITTLTWFDIFSPKPIYDSHEFIPDENGLMVFNRAYLDTCTSCLKGKLFFYLKDIQTNRWGYRYINNKNKTGLKIMLLGDALTWGLSSMPIDSSFADILSTKGYQVYNFGIPGTDPIQHEAIEKKYIDSVTPDMVILNFYAGHNFIDYAKKVIPGGNIDYYMTDHFWFPVSYYKDGDSVILFASRQNAQNYYFEDITWGKYCHNPIHRILSKTVISTYAGRFIFGRDDIGSTYSKVKYEDKTVETLLRMVRYCRDKNIKFVISIIPNRDGRNQDRISAFRHVEELSNVLSFSQMQEADYMEGADDNLNNTGHLRYAEYLDSMIRKYPL